MSESRLPDNREDDSPVGDVRRVREELSQQFGNDVRQLGEYARHVGEQAERELGCTIVRKLIAPSSTDQ